MRNEPTVQRLVNPVAVPHLNARITARRSRPSLDAGRNGPSQAEASASPGCELAGASLPEHAKAAPVGSSWGRSDGQALWIAYKRRRPYRAGYGRAGVRRVRCSLSREVAQRMTMTARARYLEPTNGKPHDRSEPRARSARA